MSVYTAEAHLSQAYAKLGIRSRTQLTRHLGPGGPAAHMASVKVG